jgi:hypothetical protein
MLRAVQQELEMKPKRKISPRSFVMQVAGSGGPSGGGGGAGGQGKSGPAGDHDLVQPAGKGGAAGNDSDSDGGAAH